MSLKSGGLRDPHYYYGGKVLVCAGLNNESFHYLRGFMEVLLHLDPFCHLWLTWCCQFSLYSKMTVVSADPHLPRTQ